MGNLAGKLDARVMRPDGTIAAYQYPIQVALLMTLHPDHLVIHCSPGPVPPGGTRKIKVMDIEDRLALGEFYIMYPIPSEYKQMLLLTGPPSRRERITLSPGRMSSSCRMASPCHSNLKLNLARCASRTKIIDGRRRRRVKIMARSILSLFSRRSAPRRKSKEGGGQVPLLAFDQNDSSFSASAFEKRAEIQKPSELTIQSPGQSPCWKPELDDIPELPGYGFPNAGSGTKPKNATSSSPTVAAKINHNRGVPSSLWEDL